MVAINGFTISPDRAKIGIKTYTVPGTSVKLPVRAEIAPLLIGAARDFHNQVEHLKAGHCWGYAYRAVRGASTPSFHSGGLAIDLNAPEHPLGTDPARTFSAHQIASIHAIARRYGLRWGGDYHGRKDPMHLEVILSRANALALVKKIQGGAAPAGWQASDGWPGAGVFVVGHSHPAVVWARKCLRNLKMPGATASTSPTWTAGDRQAAMAFQRSRAELRGDVDGVLGPVGWRLLWLAGGKGWK